MAGKTIGGISGVLGELISPSVPKESNRPVQSRIERQAVKSANTEQATSVHPGRARLGRPPGKTSRHQCPKEKVTLRIPSSLVAEYRDWSWEARCQLSELVERALAAYRESRHR